MIAHARHWYATHPIDLRYLQELYPYAMSHGLLHVLSGRQKLLRVEDVAFASSSKIWRCPFELASSRTSPSPSCL